MKAHAKHNYIEDISNMFICHYEIIMPMKQTHMISKNSSICIQ